MADLTNTVRWIRYEPDLFGNRDLEAPFWLELNGSMSKEQIRALDAALKTPLASLEPMPENATDEQLLARDTQVMKLRAQQHAAALKDFVRLGREPLTINGESIDSVEKYFDLAGRALMTLDMFLEPSRALADINRLSPRSSFSFGRLSGGFTSTTTPNGASGRGQTVAR